MWLLMYYDRGIGIYLYSRALISLCMDTASDPRILVAEKACTELVDLLNNLKLPKKWDKKKAQEGARTALSIVKEMKFCYLGGGDILTTYSQRLKDHAVRVMEGLGGTGWSEGVSIRRVCVLH